MAVTVLKNIKEARNRSPSAHLKNAIRYIMNPEKTENRLWVGGNVGSEPEEIYRAMMDTKKDYGKQYGRQGYHFVISFAPGEADTETTYLVGKEFCRRYLGDNYDYVFAVHNDQHHSHCHIVFNSVNRMDGRKYRYINGDWEALIQPITDEICIKRGLPPLVFDRTAKKGKTYAEQMAEKEGRMTGKELIRMDIDHAVACSESFEEFLQAMRQMGYRIREGHSDAKGCDYLTYYAPGLDKGRRDYNLGRGYTREDIQKRIRGEMLFVPQRIRLPTKPELQNLWQKNRYSSIRRPYVIRVMYAVFHHSLNPFEVDQKQVRKDLLEIDKLQEECSYLMDHSIGDLNQAEARMEELKEKERLLKESPEEKEALRCLREEKRILRRVLKRDFPKDEAAGIEAAGMFLTKEAPGIETAGTILPDKAPGVKPTGPLLPDKTPPGAALAKNQELSKH